MTKFSIIILSNDNECPSDGAVGGGSCPNCEDW